MIKVNLKTLVCLLFCTIIFTLLLPGCDIPYSVPEEISDNEVIITDTPSDEIIVEDKELWYSGDDPYSVVTMYLTVREGNSGENTNHTWEEVNAYSIFHYDDLGIERYRVEGILQVGDENGPIEGLLGYDAVSPNSIVQIRGNTTSSAPQKSYKIEVNKGKGLWNEQRTIILNKHVYDPIRFRNKLTYDLMQEIPDMISARTQFVHLYVKDQTGDNINNDKFVDYGLYTQVEQFNTRYLTNHGLDSGGQFYKAEMFEFYTYSDTLVLETDPNYNLDAFQDVLEIKGSTDHTKLINMLADINNDLIPIEDTFSKYFDEDNYFTWLAFQILIGNIDTTSRNFYLYSPLNSEKWYFIAWDNDGAWDTEGIDENDGVVGYEMGVSNYWGCVLHQRVLKIDKYRKMLDDKINELRAIMTEEKIAELAENYSSTVLPYVYSNPDIGYARVTESEYAQILSEIPGLIEKNYQLYLESLEKPMPFFLGEPVISDTNTLKIGWDIAFDFDDERITYKVQVSDSYLFDNIIYENDALLLPEIEIDMLPYGQYFYRVIATNESGYSQAAFDYYVDMDYVKHYGVISFFIGPDGITLDS